MKGICRVAADQPSRRLTIAILAAGASRRLGQPKQLVNIDGEPLLRRSCKAALSANIGSVAVILGFQEEACRAAIAGLPVTIQSNETWEEGIGSSIRVAADAAARASSAALLILQCDQYRITTADLQALHAAWAATDGSIAFRARHGDYSGPPVILPSACFGRARQLQGDQGARKLLESLGRNALMEIDLPNAAFDLDSPAQLALISGSGP
jgi:molybdenum cofactor cytidylyltransferase